MKNKKVMVTHRGKTETIKKIESEMNIKSNKVKKLTLWNKIWEETHYVVWVSKGKPNWWNRINSGMLGKRGEASVTFLIEENKLRKPNGMKRIFGNSQLVIDGDVILPVGSEFRYNS